MKRFFTIICLMAIAAGHVFAADPVVGVGIVAGDTVVPGSDTYPVSSDRFHYGGWHTATNEAARTGLESYLRKVGMSVYQTDTAKLYTLGADLVSWTEFVSGGGGGLSTNDSPTMAAGTTWGFVNATVTGTASNGLQVVNYQTMTNYVSAAGTFQNVIEAGNSYTGTYGQVTINTNGDYATPLQIDASSTADAAANFRNAGFSDVALASDNYGVAAAKQGGGIAAGYFFDAATIGSGLTNSVLLSSGSYSIDATGIVRADSLVSINDSDLGGFGVRRSGTNATIEAWAGLNDLAAHFYNDQYGDVKIGYSGNNPLGTPYAINITGRALLNFTATNGLEVVNYQTLTNLITTLTGVTTATVSTSPVTLSSSSETYIHVDTTAIGGPAAVNLPAASAAVDKVFHIKKLGTSGNVTVTANGADTIDGESTMIISGEWNSILIVSDGTYWYMH